MEKSEFKSSKEAKEQSQSEHESIEEQRRNTVDLSNFDELILEMRYRNKILAYFGPRLGQPKITDLCVVEDRLEEALTYEEFDGLFPYDLIVVGKLRHVPNPPDIFLIIEIAVEVNQTEVSRAIHRANLLHKAGINAVPVVAGKEVTQDAHKAIREQNVVFLQNERVLFWEEAVDSWVNIKLEKD